MSKFIQFNTQVSGATQPAEPIGPVLVNVEDIQSFAAAGNAAGGKSLVISLLGRAAGGAGQAGFQTLTLTFSTSVTAAAIEEYVSNLNLLKELILNENEVELSEILNNTNRIKEILNNK